MKTEFDLMQWKYSSQADKCYFGKVGTIKIHENLKNRAVKVHIQQEEFRLQNKDLERFAVNILKALKSKKLAK